MRLSEAMRKTAMQAIGLVAVLIGVQSFLVSGRAPTRAVPTLTSRSLYGEAELREGRRVQP